MQRVQGTWSQLVWIPQCPRLPLPSSLPPPPCAALSLWAHSKLQNKSSTPSSQELMSNPAIHPLNCRLSCFPSQPHPLLLLEVTVFTLLSLKGYYCPHSGPFLFKTFFQGSKFLWFPWLGVNNPANQEVWPVAPAAELQICKCAFWVCIQVASLGVW